MNVSLVIANTNSIKSGIIIKIGVSVKTIKRAKKIIVDNLENNVFKRASIKSRTCCYYGDTIKLADFDFGNTLLNQKQYGSILVYDFSYKTLIGSKLIIFRIDIIDGFIIVCDGTRYLVLIGRKKYDTIFNKIRYLIEVKRGITYVIFHNYARIKVDSSDSLPLEKLQTIHNNIKRLKSVWNKDQNHYYYNTFFEKFFYKLVKK